MLITVTPKPNRECKHRTLTLITPMNVGGKIFKKTLSKWIQQYMKGIIQAVWFFFSQLCRASSTFEKYIIYHIRRLNKEGKSYDHPIWRRKSIFLSFLFFLAKACPLVLPFIGNIFLCLHSSSRSLSLGQDSLGTHTEIYRDFLSSKSKVVGPLCKSASLPLSNQLCLPSSAELLLHCQGKLSSTILIPRQWDLHSENQKNYWSLEAKIITSALGKK